MSIKNKFVVLLSEDVQIECLHDTLDQAQADAKLVAEDLQERVYIAQILEEHDAEAH